jgi:hypothetical protein
MSSMSATPTSTYENCSACCAFMIESGMKSPASVRMKSRTTKKSTAPSTGPNTVAAPPRMSAVQMKNVIERPMASGCTELGRT